jgi:stress-induced-phosphoprotein 1
MKLMDFVNALSQFDKCLELEPNNVKAIAKKGNCYLMMKEYHKALSAFESGLKLDKTNVECSEGLQKTQMKIYGAGGESKEE